MDEEDKLMELEEKIEKIKKLIPNEKETNKFIAKKTSGNKEDKQLAQTFRNLANKVYNRNMKWAKQEDTKDGFNEMKGMAEEDRDTFLKMAKYIEEGKPKKALKVLENTDTAVGDEISKKDFKALIIRAGEKPSDYLN